MDDLVVAFRRQAGKFWRHMRAHEQGQPIAGQQGKGQPMPADAIGGIVHRRESLTGGRQAGNLQNGGGANLYCTLPRLVWLTPYPTINTRGARMSRVSFPMPRPMPPRGGPMYGDQDDDGRQMFGSNQGSGGLKSAAADRGGDRALRHHLLLRRSRQRKPDHRREGATWR